MGGTLRLTLLLCLLLVLVQSNESKKRPSRKVCTRKNRFILRRGNPTVICDRGRIEVFSGKREILKIQMNCKGHNRFVKGVFYMKCEPKENKLYVWRRVPKFSAKMLNSFSDQYRSFFDKWDWI